MKRILGGIVCLLLPALALAQGSEVHEQPDILLGEVTLPLIERSETLEDLPLGASLFEGTLGGATRLFLAGGVEPGGVGERAIRVWEPAERRWAATGLYLPGELVPRSPVSVTWIDHSAGSFLSLGTSNLRVDPRPAAFLDDRELSFDTTGSCSDLAAETSAAGTPLRLGSSHFFTKPAGALGTPDTLAVFLYLVDPDFESAEGRFYSVAQPKIATGAPDTICFQRILDRISIPEDRVFASVLFDPTARQGEGALLFAGGQGVSQSRNTTAVAYDLQGVAEELIGSGSNQSPEAMIPLADGSGVLLLVDEDPTQREDVPGLVEARYDQTSGRYELTPRAAPVGVGGQPPAGVYADGFDAGMWRLAREPSDGTLVLYAHTSPASAQAGGHDVDGASGTQSDYVTLREGTLALFGQTEHFVIWPRQYGTEFTFLLTLDGEPTGRWGIDYRSRDDGVNSTLEFGKMDSQTRDDGLFVLSLEGYDPEESYFTLIVLDGGNKYPVLDLDLLTTVRERESVYRGFGCQSGGGSGGLALVLLALLLAGARRRQAPALLLAGLLLSASLPARAEEAREGRPRLAFLGVTPGAGVDALTAEAISDYIQTLTAETQGYDVIRLTEVKEMLGFEAQKQLLGCDESGCLADIAGALDVDRLLRASVSRIGSSMMIQLTLLDGREATQIRASGMRLEEAEDAEPVLDVLPEILDEVFQADERFEGKRVKARSRLGKKRGSRGYVPEHRWSLGAGVDIDVANGGGTLLGLHVGYRSRVFGFGLSVMPRMGVSPIEAFTVPVGLRAEVRLRLFKAGPVHPNLVLGTTMFPTDALLARAGVHVDVDLHRFLRAYVALAAEALTGNQPFHQGYAVLSVGAAFVP
ncbi:MAG: hypothetical protein P1V51_00055 [Deltaproteobacteria bacterium]|nr:hypothetical protein [Deltaproteobacteria bacterium]